MESIVNLIIFHRKLGCIDEAATDEEQGEKVLYYYPPTPLYDQLGRINMLEGLIEFSCKFAITPEDDVNIVTMEKNTWVFYQCEPEIWIVCGISNKPTRISSSVAPMGHVGSPTVVGSRYSSPTKAKDNVSFHKQIPNGAGLLVAIKKMYEIYAQFNGSIEGSIAHRQGWTNIAQVAKLRKKRRKCDQARRQIQQDVDSLNWQLEQQEERDRIREDKRQREEKRSVGVDAMKDGEDDCGQSKYDDEIANDALGSVGDCDSRRPSLMSEDTVAGFGAQQLGYRADMGSMEELQSKAQAVEAEISALSAECMSIATGSSYTPTLTRNRLANFMDMYLYAGELLFPSLFHSMAGVHLAPVGHPAFQSLLGVRQALAESSDNKVIGSVIFHDGDVIWTDVDDVLVQNISTFVRIQEYAYIRNSYRWSFATKGDKQSTSHATRSGATVNGGASSVTATTTAAAAAVEVDGVLAGVTNDADTNMDTDYDTEGDGTATEGTVDNGRDRDDDDDGEEEEEEDDEDVEGFFDEHGAAAHEDPDEIVVEVAGGDDVVPTSGIHEVVEPDVIGMAPDVPAHSSAEAAATGLDHGPKKTKTLKEKLRDRMQRLLHKQASDASGESVGHDAAKFQQELEDEWLQQMLQRSGFVSQYWTSLDLDQGQNFGGYAGSSGGHDAMNRSEFQFVKEFEYMLRRSGSVAMRRASLNLHTMSSLNNISGGNTATVDSGHVYDRETLNMCVGSSQKVFCPLIYDVTNTAEQEEDLLKTLGTPKPNSTQYSKVGRLVIYRQDRFLVAVLVNDWVDSSSRDTDGGEKLINPFETSSSSDADYDAGVVTINTVVTSLLTMCRHIQRGIQTELGSLYSVLGQPTAILGVPPRKRYHLSPTARLIYYNELNTAVKIGNVYKQKADPVLVWPFNIHHIPGCLVRQNKERSYSLLNQERLETIASPGLMARLSDLRPRFNLPPGLLAQSIEGMTCAALNECWVNLEGHATHDCDIVEICIRVRATYKGGLWVIAKKTAQRTIFLALERCSTLSEAHEALTMTTGGVLSSVFI